MGLSSITFLIIQLVNLSFLCPDYLYLISSKDDHVKLCSNLHFLLLFTGFCVITYLGSIKQICSFFLFCIHFLPVTLCKSTHDHICIDTWKYLNSCDKASLPLLFSVLKVHQPPWHPLRSAKQWNKLWSINSLSLTQCTDDTHCACCEAASISCIASLAGCREVDLRWKGGARTGCRMVERSQDLMWWGVSAWLQRLIRAFRVWLCLIFVRMLPPLIQEQIPQFLLTRFSVVVTFTLLTEKLALCVLSPHI